MKFKILFLLIIILLASVCFADLFLKLPYEAKENFQITQGYNSLPTHVNKDLYALDLTQDGCKAFGKPVLAVADGKVVLVKLSKDYGNLIKINNGNNIESIYAHLESSIVNESQEIKQGELIGYVGNTGLKLGTACSEHPGTHLHFAMYQKQADGTFLAYKPEPISGHSNLVAGMTLASDNILVQKEKPSGLFAFLANTFSSVIDLFSESKLNNSVAVTTPETIMSAADDVEHSVSNIAAESEPEPTYDVGSEQTSQTSAVSQIQHMRDLTNTNDVANPQLPMPGVGNLTPSIIEPKFSFAGAPYAGFGGGGGGASPQTLQTTTVVVSAEPSAPPANPEPEEPPIPEPEIPVDVTPPDVSLNILECQNSFSSDGCLVATTTLNISWQSLVEDFDYYEFTQNGTTSTTTATSTIISVLDNSTNNFSARAVDKTGNWSAPQTTTVVVSSMPVVINEVAWAGTEASSTDEWIELYNRTNYPINLQNWVLYSETKKPYINLSGTIPAHDYYLMERKDNETVGDITADLIYGNDGSNWALNNSGEILTLSYASSTIDRTVLCGAGPVWWCPGFDYKYRTMERRDPDLSGTDSINWSYNDGLTRNGKDVASQAIYGTPKARNSVNYLIANSASNIYSDITLTKSKSPYVVNNITQTFSSSTPITLTIEPGVVIKFYNSAGLNFSGNSKIIAQGTAEEPIVFTSYVDDAYGGDLDATSTTPYAGGWLSVRVETANNDSVFDHTLFRYGGKYYSMGDYSRANLSIQNSSAIISNSIFEHSLAYGLKLTNSNSNVSNNIFRNNNYVGDTAGINSAIYVLGGSPQIRNNTISQNGRGIYLSGSSAVVDSNVISLNVGEAIYSSGMTGIISNNSGSGNGTDGIIFSLSGSSNSSATLKTNPLPYILNSVISVASSTTLTIESGVTIKCGGGYWGGRLDVSGNLLVNGISAGDVIFTSNYASPGKEDWQGIRLYSGSYSNIKGATISNSYNAVIYENSPANLENVKFENNSVAVKADSASISQGVVSTSTVEFLNNTTNTSPAGLW